MFNISSFLEKFSKRIRSQNISYDDICEIIRKKARVECNRSSLFFQNGILYINHSPAIKNKIFISKKDILDSLNKKSSQKIIDIR